MKTDYMTNKQQLSFKLEKLSMGKVLVFSNVVGEISSSNNEFKEIIQTEVLK